MRAQCTLAAHYGEYIIRPVAVTPAMFLICFRLWKFRSPKTKRDNAFQYVVLRPPAPYTSVYIIAATGGCRCKFTKSFWKNATFGAKILQIMVPTFGREGEMPILQCERGSQKELRCAERDLAVVRKCAVNIFLNFRSVVIWSFFGYLHIGRRFFTRFFIFTLTFFGTNLFLSHKIFEIYLHTYIMPLNVQ